MYSLGNTEETAQKAPGTGFPLYYLHGVRNSRTFNATPRHLLTRDSMHIPLQTFASTTSTGWLTTCVIAVLMEAFFQQPVLLLSTGILGDFVEQGAEFILEILA